MIDITEQLGQSTIRIIIIRQSAYYVGTGFVFKFQSNTVEKKVIVTNKHVIENLEGMKLIFTEAQNNLPIYGSNIELEFDRSEVNWIFHPDPKVDLAILDLNKLPNKNNSKGKTLFISWLDENYIPEISLWNTLSYHEEIIMFGYPSGLIDSYNNLPILRSGVTATQPKINFNNREEFLTDIHNFGGSSGSPIFLKRKKLKQFDSEPCTIRIGEEEYYNLLGIHFAGQGYNIKTQATEMIHFDSINDISEKPYRVPLNIGHAIKSYKILDFKPILFDY